MSVIIPTFNEQDVIEDCLRAVLRLDDPVDEIIVVDNNSTDNTRAVVTRIAQHNTTVRLVTADDQGVINARSVGFDAARSDILARIDADTRVAPGWSLAIREFFRDNGDQFVAGTGLCTCYDLPFQALFRRGHAALTQRATRALQSGDIHSASTSRLFGSNMAISRSSWQHLSSRRSQRTDIYEDLDLSLTVRAAGGRIGLIPGADAAISGRRYLSSPRLYLKYCLRDQRTFRAHGHRRRAALAVLTTIAIQYPFYLALWIPFRTYDPDTHRMDIRRIRHLPPTRVLPSGS